MLSRADGRTEKGGALIHSTAIIDPSAQIADDCEIGPYSIIGADVEIGSGTIVKAHAVITGPTVIGKNNVIYSFAAVGGDPQDLKFAGERTELIIGDHNTIRENATIHRGTGDGGGITKIGSNNLFMAYTHVAHDCMVGNHVIMSNAVSLAGHVVVGDHSILGGFTGVHQFTHIGAHSFSGFGSMVNRDIPPYVLVAGNHARAIGINKKGLQRRDFDNETVAALHTAFRTLIKSRLPREEALVKLEDLIQQYAEVREFVEFVTSSERSVVR